MPGLHLSLLEGARASGMAIELGRTVPWLSGRGHLNDNVVHTAPAEVLAALGNIHAALGGDADALASKRPGNAPTPDLVHRPTGCLIEVDEVQHFSTARRTTFGRYPAHAVLGFDPAEYLALIEQWQTRADAAYAHKRSTDFPQIGGRQAQRAYNDALRDLLAPIFTGHPVIRIPLPHRSMEGALARLAEALDRVAPQ